MVVWTLEQPPTRITGLEGPKDTLNNTGMLVGVSQVGLGMHNILNQGSEKIGGTEGLLEKEFEISNPFGVLDSLEEGQIVDEIIPVEGETSSRETFGSKQPSSDWCLQKNGNAKESELEGVAVEVQQVSNIVGFASTSPCGSANRGIVVNTHQLQDPGGTSMNSGASVAHQNTISADEELARPECNNKTWR